MTFDKLVQLMRIKMRLSSKYAALARTSKSSTRQGNATRKSLKYRRQAITYSRGIRLGTFVRKMDDELMPRIKNSVIQVLRESWFAMEPGGTANLFEIGGARFVITAAHVIHDATVRGLGMYVPCYRSGELVQIVGGVKYNHALDIAALRLADDVAVALDGYTFLTPADTDTTDMPATQGLHYAYGYPSFAAFPSVVEAKVRSRGLPIVAYLAEGNPRFRRDSADHLWLDAFANTYDLNGISGCAVWRSIQDGGSPLEWTPADAKVVAVEHSVYYKFNIIEATRIRHVFELIRSRWPDLAPHLDPYL